MAPQPTPRSDNSKALKGEDKIRSTGWKIRFPGSKTTWWFVVWKDVPKVIPTTKFKLHQGMTGDWLGRCFRINNRSRGFFMSRFAKWIPEAYAKLPSHRDVKSLRNHLRSWSFLSQCLLCRGLRGGHLRLHVWRHQGSRLLPNNFGQITVTSHAPNARIFTFQPGDHAHLLFCWMRITRFHRFFFKRWCPRLGPRHTPKKLPPEQDSDSIPHFRTYGTWRYTSWYVS